MNSNEDRSSVQAETYGIGSIIIGQICIILGIGWAYGAAFALIACGVSLCFIGLIQIRIGKIKREEMAFRNLGFLRKKPE